MTAEPLCKIGSLAREAGITPTLLRAWERRYALFAPQRGRGGQRLYGQDDILLARYLVSQVARGGRIGELTPLGREQLLQLARDAEHLTPQADRHSGPEQIECAASITALIAAAMRLDGPGLLAELARDTMVMSLDTMVFRVVVPTMRQIGDSYLAGQLGVAEEHLISGVLEQWLRGAILQAGSSGGESRQRVVSCCFPGEEHRLGLLTVAYRLAREGCEVVILGASVPLASLEETIKRIRPELVCLSVTVSRHYIKSRQALVALAKRCQVPIVIGGQGVPLTDRLLEQAGCHLWSGQADISTKLELFSTESDR